MGTGLEVGSWTTEAKASNLQTHFRIKHKSIAPKAKSWALGVGTSSPPKGGVSNHTQVVPEGIINLCSQRCFPIQSRKRADLGIWGNSAYSSHNCIFLVNFVGVKGRPELVVSLYTSLTLASGSLSIKHVNASYLSQSIQYLTGTRQYHRERKIPHITSMWNLEELRSS